MSCRVEPRKRPKLLKYVSSNISGMTDSRREYFEALVSHEVSLWDAVDRHLAEAGVVRTGRLAFLRVVGNGLTTRVQDVADRLGITVGAASRFTDRMVADGLVARTPNPADRRSSFVSLTKSGAKSLEESEAVFTAALDRLLSGVDDSELTELTAKLIELRTAVAQNEAD